jgi:hypothetical protein
VAVWPSPQKGARQYDGKFVDQGRINAGISGGGMAVTFKKELVNMSMRSIYASNQNFRIIERIIITGT